MTEEFSTEARRRWERFIARDHERIAPLGRTILLLHSTRRERAILLFHGLSASPTQFVRFAEDLHARGHNVIVPRLPHHGRSDRVSGVQARLTSEELCEFVREAIAIARDIGDQVTVAGFSVGAVLALWAAQHESISRAVAIAPFLGVSWIPNRLMQPICEVLLRWPNRFIWWNPILRARLLPAHGYPRFSTHALAHAYLLARRVIDDAAVFAPWAAHVALVTNTKEAAVNNRAVRRLAARMHAHRGNARIELVTLRGLPITHDIIEPLHHPKVANRIYPRLLTLIDPEVSE